ncbi:MAG: hypothetical protein KDC83_10640 [Flavobacteriales bacterium]|nr:hypothetical protein [Flavobacteriales bacterium]
MIKRITLGTLVFATIGLTAFSHVGPTEGGSRGGKKPNSGLAANCAPSSFASELNINNTRAVIQTGGDMWWDFAKAQYEIPKNSGHTALFAGALWLGGRDISGQLKVAAQRFRSNGVDFWTGPLSTVDAEITQAECSKWDKHFLTTRSEVAQFVGWYETGQNDPAKQAELFPDYTVPRSIIDWPAHGENAAPYNQDYYLAPFVDRDGDGNYNPESGDYPAYDLNNASECNANITDIYGDQNLWWIFNDKGNIHTESGAGAIGMEIRAQAFAFSTNDEVNNMTFYNYELVNRSTFTLTDTYFGQWVDADLGCSSDDYVGCDVERGLGFAYNGDTYDEDCRGVTGYGNLPPAIGVDFFQGPYQDADGIDNPLIRKYTEAQANLGIPYKGIGIGYGDGVIDNERFGMRKFLYHNNDNTVRGDPNTGVEYYNYLRSIWRDGSRMVYGGTGHSGSGGTINADYMFPGNSDPIGWGTGGAPQPEWTEVTAGNTKGDRRFMQSAGPFTLEPGAVNNITVGVVWSRATTGNNTESVKVLKKHDDKTQALFDNCFQLLNGPDAPTLTAREFENQIILYLNNPIISNNFNENYLELDPTIIPPDSIGNRPMTESEIREFKTYRFQGYKIYQLKNNSVSSGDLGKADLARLVAQVDIKDSIDQIINYYFDSDLGAEVPRLEVDGNNEGILTSFSIDQDQFAEGDKKLINNKAYYFMAVAYASNMNAPSFPYIGSRKSPTGGISPVKAIPHKTEVQNGGTILNSRYGDGVVLTRIEGTGNGGNVLEISQNSRDSIVKYGRAKTITYLRGKGPVSIKVVDPLNVKPGNYTIRFIDTTSNGDLSDAYWQIEGGGLSSPIVSTKNIKIGTETILFDLGISLTIAQVDPPGAKSNRTTDMGLLSAEISQSPEWITGVEDVDGYTPLNWILSGTQTTPPDPNSPVHEENYDDWNYRQRDGGTSGYSKNGEGLDPGQLWEQVLSGTVAPFRMTAFKTSNGPVPGWLPAKVDGSPVFGGHLWQYNNIIIKKNLPSPPNDSAYVVGVDSFNQLHYLNSVDLVITRDKSKWTRCPVFEMADSIKLGGTTNRSIRGQLRDAPSVDKNGNPATAGAVASDDPESAAYIGPNGMGWFPGYAINLETGERLNMAFSEDSYLPAENGRDMIWNPTANLVEGPAGELRLGGMHYIYVFRNNAVEDEVNRYDQHQEKDVESPAMTWNYNYPVNRMPAYDAGKFAYTMLNGIYGYPNPALRDSTGVEIKRRAGAVFRAGMWVAFPLLEEGKKFTNKNVPPGEATIKLRVQKPYEAYGTSNDFLKPTDPLVVGETYYVAAGPVKQVKDTATDSIYVRGMTLTANAATVSYRYGNYRNSTVSREGNDSVDVLMRSINGGLPLYNFSTTDLAPTFNSDNTLSNALDLIKIVPNPYYAYSSYETDKLDNRIRITNLPRVVTVRIYTVNGTLVRTLKKDDDTITYLEWDLKNQSRVPIASGMYIFHIDAQDVGERVLKWMGVMRPIDLDNF